LSHPCVRAHTLSLLASVAILPALHADLPESWSWRNPLPTGITLEGVAHGSGRYLAVDARGDVWSSTDGSSWENDGPSGSPRLRSLRRLGDRFYATGDDGFLATSSDGSAWSSEDTGVDVALHAVASHAGTRVAVGSRGTILVSQAGGPWTPVDSGLGLTLRDVTRADARWVVVGDDGATVLTSEDGVTWDARDSGVSLPLLAVAARPDRIVALGRRFAAATSTDGIEWAPLELGEGPDFQTMIEVDGGFLAAGDRGLIARAENGLEWDVLAPATEHSIRGLAADGAFVAAGELGTFLRSEDGITWEKTLQSSALTTLSLYRLAFGNERFVAVGQEGIVLHSPDGERWTLASSGEDFAIQWGLAFGEGVFVSSGRNQETGAGIVATSADGETWERTFETSPAAYAGAAYGEFNDRNVLAAASVAGSPEVSPVIGVVVSAPGSVVTPTRSSPAASTRCRTPRG